jgi:monoamine oxidase
VSIGIQRNGEASQIRASKAIITLPLAVLLTGGVHFRPRPEKVLEAAARLRMGAVQRTVLQFREPFWMNSTGELASHLRKLSFLYSTGNAPSVWWTPFPEKHPRLTAWTGGPRVASLPQNQVELERRLLNQLARILGRDDSAIRKLFVGSFMHDWQRDPFSLGAYSYVTVNAENASEIMAEPLDETLYFAGEHTDMTGHWGTVHGAFRSGLRAASQVLSL